MFQLPWLDSDTAQFPATHHALQEPNGLLAAGGQLNPEWLITAYTRGIFPWFSEEEPILWWSPSPRSFIYINQLHISKSLHKALRKKQFSISIDQAFEQVIDACAKPREQQAESGTWITEEMRSAYIELHHIGKAHSIEVWINGELSGGLYGIALGRVFFGESMFSTKTNGSKIALFALVEQLKQWQYIGIDCQVHNPHLESMGAQELERHKFESLLDQYV